MQGHSAASGSLSGDSGYEPATRRACRVMALRGRATYRTFSDADHAHEGKSNPYRAGDGGAEVRLLARGDLLPEGETVDLDEDSDITVHATVSTREISLVGPARFVACPDGEEIVRLAQGKVTAVPGAGIRPGAEVWVATPLGVVRFNDARIEVDVPNRDASRLRISVGTGQAIFVLAPNAVVAPSAPSASAPEASSGAPPQAPKVGKPGIAADAGTGDSGSIDLSARVLSIEPGSVTEVSRPKGTLATWMTNLVTACSRDGDAASKLAERIAAVTDRADIGNLAFQHVRARQLGRGSCESVRAAAMLQEGLLQGAELRAFAAGDGNWQRTAPFPRPRGALPDAH